MAHEKKAHKRHHDSHARPKKVGMIEPMAHGKGAQHLKSVKKGHKEASGK